MDITMKTKEGNFNYRVCGIILHENKILAMHDGRSPYYYLPGGRVKLNETAEKALLRELNEELHIDAKIIRPLWLNQGYFTEDVNHEKYHELCLYFLIDFSYTDLLSRGTKFIVREKNRQNNFEWLDFDQLKDEYFYPIFLKEKIKNLPDEFTLITNID
ncbi:MAG: NUDIX hydrolase [Traorella sp.]